ncbi:hypothetical protein FRC03_008783 [Tulasnella sp. 419]|nr:hypothetical protein FRC03_008783 [Tulasnella sp. 419]
MSNNKTTMQYVRLGKSGLKISRIIPSQRSFLERPSRSNSPRDEIVVMAKLFGAVQREMDAPMPFQLQEEDAAGRYTKQQGLSRKHIFESVKHSLERLQHIMPANHAKLSYNAVDREEEREVMPLLKDLGVGCIPWSPLARGFLTKDINAITTRTQKDQ